MKPESGGAGFDDDWDRTASELEQLVVECLQSYGEIGPAALEAICARRPDLAAALRERIARLAEIGMLPAADITNPPKRIGGFGIIKEIGRGGMGVVFLAEQTEVRRLVALKVLAPGSVFNTKALERFRREAWTAAKLTNPGIVEVHAVGEHAGVHWIAMELVAGASLENAIEELLKLPKDASDAARLESLLLTLKKGAAANAVEGAANAESAKSSKSASNPGARRIGRTYVETICNIIAEVAGTLQFAHERGVVHRDVKPANILLRADGAPLLSDFGLARESSLPGLTASGEFAGTPYYVSPEQAGPRGDAVGPRSDIYSLGVTLYELLTLKRPFEGRTSQEVLSRVLADEPENPRRHRADLPRELATILLKSIEKDPARRYETAGGFAADLRAFLEYRPIQAEPATAASRVRKFARRRPGTAVGAFAAAILTIAGSIYYYIRPGELVITSPIDGASVFVDGAPRGLTDAKTPLVVRVAPGIHQLRIEKKDAELASPGEEIVVSRGERRAVDRALASLRGALRLESAPPGANVTISAAGSGTINKATTPALVDLPAGPHRVRFELEGFDAREMDVTILPGGIVIPCAVSWEVGNLILESRQPGVRVSVYAGASAQGAPIRTATLPRAEPFILPKGIYSIRASAIERADAVLEGARAVALESGPPAIRNIWLPEISRKFDAEITGRVFASAIAKLDGAGIKSYVWATEKGRVMAARADGARKFEADAGGDVRRMAIADWDGDGVDEVFVTLDAGGIQGYDARGERIVNITFKGFPLNIEACRHAGESAIVSGTTAGEIHILQKGKPDAKINSGGPADFLELADLDGDGEYEIITGSRSGYLEAHTLAGVRLFRTHTGAPVRAMRIVDRAKAGRQRIVVMGGDDHINVFDAKGNKTGPLATTAKPQFILASDLDGDGADEIVLIAHRILQVFDGAGTMRFEREVSGNMNNVSFVQFDNNEKRTIVAGTSTSHVIAWNADGSARFDTPLNCGRIEALAVEKFANDKNVSVVVGTERGKVIGIDARGGTNFYCEMRGRAAYVESTDANGDGVAEIAVGTWGGHVAILQPQNRTQFMIDASSDVHAITTVPREITNRPGVIVGTEPGRMLWIESKGRVAREMSIPSTPSTFAWMRNAQIPKLLVGTSAGYLLCFDGGGAEAWRYKSETWIQSLAIANITGNGNRETAFATHDGHYEVLSEGGTRIWDHRSPEGDGAFMAVADTDGDGKCEIAVDNGGGELELLSTVSGSAMKAKVMTRISNLRMADLDGDGNADVLASGDGEIAAFRRDGGNLWRTPVPGGTVYINFGDFDGDGRLDFAGMVQGKEIVFMNCDGTARAVRPEPSIVMDAVAADFDADGTLDLTFALANGEIQQLRGDGARRIRIFHPDVTRILASADFDLDGKLELVAGCDGGGLLSFDFASIDPRAAHRDLFIKGLEAAEKGDEAHAAEAFGAAGLAWIAFDDWKLEEWKARLIKLNDSAAARKALESLKLVSK
ncbi:MAG: protein kinase [Planctomycetes bacterium]|nr:protein kinase [Planctomycetota bacterium]